MAVVVCIHPCQMVMSIKDGANDLIHHSFNMPERSMSALCHLPKCSAGTFYPSPLNHSFLALPYFRLQGEEKKVRLDTPIMLNKYMLVRRLHRQQTEGGDEAVVPPIYLKDPGIPRTLEVGYMGPMWKNTQYISVVPTGGTSLQGSQPALSEVTFCVDEFNTKNSLAPLKGAGIVYSPKWYDETGKPRENLNIRKPDDELTIDPKLEGGPNRTTSPLPTPRDPAKVISDEDAKSKDDEDTKSDHEDDEDAKSNNDDADAKSKQASDSGSGSGSGNSSSSSSTEDSSKDSSSSKFSKGESEAQSDAQSDIQKCKVR